MIKVLPIAIASFYVLVGFANATKNRPEMGNDNNHIVKQDIVESSLSMILSKELADFSLDGSLSQLVGTEMEPENLLGTTGTKSSKLDLKDAKSKETKSAKTKSAKGAEPDPSSFPSTSPSQVPSPFPSASPSEVPSSFPSASPSRTCVRTGSYCRRALREGELTVKENVPLERRLEIIKSMEPFGAKRDATFPHEYDLISKTSCDSLVKHMETSLQYDIESGVELLPVLSSSGGAEDAYESSFSYEDGLANQYNKKLCECDEPYE
jgi:hypothetical protein